MTEIENPIAQNELDVLDRRAFVDQILRVAENLSERRKSASYAINGRWGVGKSFILDMLEKSAEGICEEGKEEPRFLIFRYNCWAYDYYEEPLVALVASMLDKVGEEGKTPFSDAREKIVTSLKACGGRIAETALIPIVGPIISNILVEAVKGFVVDENGRDSRYDNYFGFQENLNKLREEISKLAENQTVIFIVDELDRCLPQYTVKVLERLHHLFYGVENVQVILSLDMLQLEYTIKEIYGEETDAAEYLRKFIDFRLELDEGTVKDNFNERFQEYTKLFGLQSRFTTEIDADEFKTCILEGLDMRYRIEIINRCEMIHKMLLGEEPVDLSFMCVELLFAILSDCNLNVEYAKERFSISNVFGLIREPSGKTLPKCLSELSEEYKRNLQPAVPSRRLFYRVGEGFEINTECVLGRTLYAYRKILGFEDYTSEVVEKELIECSQKFWNMLQIIH